MSATRNRIFITLLQLHATRSVHGCGNKRQSVTERVTLLPTALARQIIKSAVSVRLFPLYLLNQLTSDLDCRCMGYDYSLPGIED